MAQQQIEETWSTHQMRVTLSNLGDVYYDARRHAQQDETGAMLRDWVATWFRGDLSLLHHSSRGAVEWLRGNMSEAEWDEIDWESVAEDLGEE